MHKLSINDIIEQRSKFTVFYINSPNYRDFRIKEIAMNEVIIPALLSGASSAFTECAINAIVGFFKKERFSLA